MIRTCVLLLGLLAACTPETPPPAASDASDPNAVQYLCADGTKIATLLGTDGNLKLTLKGENFNLIAEQSASGNRYGWPSDGSNYVWWTKGDEGTLFWKDGTKGGAESILHAKCKQQ
ncbi:hypothetical protein GCM10010873_27530 [Cypionkella aquatica]|uniref:C-type lysozyme inhibitor domain-containing protein n=1 Tax=Cypionkella aquatica TaxID=1756042 RepID=A0AA37TUA9_9RHOB|nr:MliC family protein [Cypionkella aquatica]GLS87779.1 hypothetical protein GCM10010873_27530 [Cypionkella aquatica]